MCAIVFVDTIVFAVVAPLLPSLSHELHLSKLSAGILTGALAAGNVIGSIPGGIVAARAGSRWATVVGLIMLAATNIAFGLGNDVVTLDLARFIQGLAEAFVWSGAFSWLITEAPPERRGALIGLTIAAAGAGSLFGPVIGTIAHLLGREVVFVSFAAIPLAFAAISWIYGESARSAAVGLRTMAAALTHGAIMLAGWIVLLGGAAQAMITVLAPLRMAAIGGTAAAIGAAFLASAGFESVASVVGGRASDRHGPALPLVAGLIGGTVMLPWIAAAGSQLLLAAIVALLGGAVGLIWAPSMAAISDAGESSELPNGLTFALSNMTWGVGATVGAWGGGGIAKAAGDGFALGVAAGVWAVTAVILAIRSGSGRRSL